MPITKSAKKALRQSLRRRERNLIRKNKLRKAIKEFKKSLEQENFDKARKQLDLVYKAADKLAKVNYIKKNKASRIKSRITKLLNKSVK